MKNGYVYVITTDLYKLKNIYKIGYTEDLNKRLKQFNNTRTYFDKFFISNCWKTTNYMSLETKIHNILKDYRLKNELFQVNIETINKIVENIFKDDTFFIHYDLVVENANKLKLQWLENKNYFILDYDGVIVMMNDVRITDEMISHTLGEFTINRKRVSHSAPGIGATRSSASLSVK